jgi:hypothetical protein
MNDIELDEMLNKWTAPAPPESLRERVRAGFHPRKERRIIRWMPWKSLTAGAVLAGGALLFLARQAVPQTMPPERHPYTVVSEFVQYASDGSPTVAMYSTSYNDQYGREILLSRYIPDNSVHDTIARMLDAASKGTGTIRLVLAVLLSPSGREMMAKQAAATPSPAVNTQCADEKCISGVGHFLLPKAAANPGIGCVDGPPADREAILGYPTAAIQLPLDGNRVRRTVWMAPALGCFALKVSTEAQQPDGRFRLLNGKQAVAVRLNTDPR